MVNVGRASTIRNHPARAEIDRALSAGEPYRSIAQKFSVSRSALSRYNLSRKPLVRVMDDEPNITDAVARLVEAARDAGELRRLTRVSANPPARARAIKVEADILTTLIDRLGIDDLAVDEFLEQVQELARGLQKFAKEHPESARELVATLDGTPVLRELSDAIKEKIENA